MTKILLIPDKTTGTSLLKPGPCESRVPKAHLDHVAGKPPKPCPVCGSALKWFCPPTDQMDPCYICPVDWQHKFKQSDILIPEWQAGSYSDCPQAIVLAWGGEIVHEGVNRAALVLAHSFGYTVIHAVVWQPGTKARVESHMEHWLTVWTNDKDDAEKRTVESKICGKKTCAPADKMVVVLRYNDVPVDLEPSMLSVWALAALCEERGLGTVVLVQDPVPVPVQALTEAKT